MPDFDYQQLEQRVGRLHLRQRLGIETDHETEIFGQGYNFFHIENWFSIHSLIRNSLRLVGLHGRGRRNTGDLRITRHDVFLPNLPAAFDGFTILQISDLHLDMNAIIPEALVRRLTDVDYDLCVLTGDFRARTFGPFVAVMTEMARVRPYLKGAVYGVLGNHDTIRMVPGLEALGIRMLLNESVTIERSGEVIHVAGIDDHHYYCVDNIEKAADHLPPEEVSILLSHSPEIYKRAARNSVVSLNSPWADLIPASSPGKVQS